MALSRVWIASPNYSSRGGAGVRLIVLHTAEGSRTIESLGSFFASSSSGVSSHAGADDKVNTIGEYVKRGNKAWTQGNANPVACSIEMCAFAAWSPAEWDAHPNMLNNVAQWIKEEAAAFGIPIVRLNASQAQGSGRGVCQHVDLGSWGGGHVDCGGGFPMDKVLSMASGGAPIAPGPTLPSQPAKPGTAAPPFPLPPGYYYGPASGPVESVSGYYPPHGGPNGAPGLKQWQAQMAARSWTISADGFYGDQTQAVASQFQREKGLQQDGGKIGPETWGAAWTAPIT